MMKLSSLARRTMTFRRAVHAKTEGRCFYCGAHVLCGDERPLRDWLLVRGGNWMIPDHADPRKRGGADGIENRLPSCSGCNAAKGALTVAEFRTLQALKAEDPSFTFACEQALPRRDWLCVFSPDFLRDLFFHNQPAAIGVYGRGKTARRGIGSQVPV